MPIVLALLDGVSWHDEPVVGDRPQALLAALVLAGRTVRAESLVDQVWRDDVPANPAKALQVLVSRTRTSCGPDAVQRDGDGYRLGLQRSEVDALVLADGTAAAASWFDSDPATAAALLSQALEVGELAAEPADDPTEGPLAELRAEAAGCRRRARALLARARARSGDHAAALPVLLEAWATAPDDEALLTDLLRSEAATRGTAAALQRYENYRTGVRDRLGTEPGEGLRRVHGELLALDSPVRDGLHYDATTLLGREQDVRRIHAQLAVSRVVSVLGPGGLGKTRLAHVIGRESTMPVVHFVELVGVTAPDDLIGEVGSALGVRDSVSGRRKLTPEQRADVRARIAQHLDQSPSLLILDNCEHIVAVVADLVAYLVATTRTLRVLTTTRAPLAIAAETVYPLGELSTADAVELFGQRAVAARPDVQITGAENESAVIDIVRRLDGLPLAIELAAAKVRVMSTTDIARRLENRFALLRGGDRSAPDRHQTLLAVIDWSWNLLGEPERHALRWLSVFHDGFTLEGAEAILGTAALEAVQDLSDQSLLSVVEVDAGIRYRMLETVREFGRMQLVDAGEEDQAAAAHRSWAVNLCQRHGAELFSPAQFAAMDAIRAEESNLADVLRQSLAAADPATMVQVLGALGGYWTILGDHSRVIVLIDAVADTVAGWTPPPELEDITRVTLVMTLNNSLIAGTKRSEPVRLLLAGLGAGDDPRVSAIVLIALAFDPADMAGFVDAIAAYADSPDRYLAMHAEQMTSHALEHTGDPVTALRAAERALARALPEDGPWLAAIMHAQIAQLSIQLGDDVEVAVRHARAALPTLERLGALDDALQLRSVLVLAAIAGGDLDRAALELGRLTELKDTDAIFGGQLALSLGEAELALALGDDERGLELYRRSVVRVRALELPGMIPDGLEPWLLFGESAALTAYAYHGGPDDRPVAEDLWRTCVDRLQRISEPEFAFLDYPVCGLVLFALGAWGLLQRRLPDEDAVRLLVLAHRYSYNRMVPSMSWERIVPIVEDRSPGLLARVQGECGDRHGPQLLGETRAFIASL